MRRPHFISLNLEIELPFQNNWLSYSITQITNFTWNMKCEGDFAKTKLLNFGSEVTLHVKQRLQCRQTEKRAISKTKTHFQKKTSDIEERETQSIVLRTGWIQGLIRWVFTLDKMRNWLVQIQLLEARSLRGRLKVENHRCPFTISLWHSSICGC